MKAKVLTILMVIALLVSIKCSEAAVVMPVTVDDGLWYEFNWYDGQGSVWKDLSQDVLYFTFTLSNPAILTVTDAYLSGDMFNVTNFGSSIGDTSFPGSDGDQIGGNYTAAAADARWSTGKFSLAVGSYNITGTTIRLATDDAGKIWTTGVGALRVDTQVIPEPTTLSLLGLGLLGLFGLRKRKI